MGLAEKLNELARRKAQEEEDAEMQEEEYAPPIQPTRRMNRVPVSTKITIQRHQEDDDSEVEEMEQEVEEDDDDDVATPVMNGKTWITHTSKLTTEQTLPKSTSLYQDVRMEKGGLLCGVNFVTNQRKIIRKKYHMPLTRLMFSVC